MALLIVLWLLNTSKPVREAIAGYFREPAGTEGKLGTSSEGPGAQVVVAKDDMSKLKNEPEKAISHMPDFDKLKDQIAIKVTAEGLRIELLESATGTFFDLGSPNPNQNGKELLDLLAGELGKLPNKISIEGPTDSKPYSGKRNYGNWELSVDRANSARRLMQQEGWERSRSHKSAASLISSCESRRARSILPIGEFPSLCNTRTGAMRKRERQRRRCRS